MPVLFEASIAQVGMFNSLIQSPTRMSTDSVIEAAAAMAVRLSHGEPLILIIRIGRLGVVEAIVAVWVIDRVVTEIGFLRSKDEDFQRLVSGLHDRS